jgi:hypothetical protein
LTKYLRYKTVNNIPIPGNARYKNCGCVGEAFLYNSRPVICTIFLSKTAMRPVISPMNKLCTNINVLGFLSLYPEIVNNIIDNLCLKRRYFSNCLKFTF